MLSKDKMHEYQMHGVNHVLNNFEAGLIWDMGLGKSCTALTAADELLNLLCEVNKPLIIAPLRVAEDTWQTEAANWLHLNHLTFSKILGTEKQRITGLRAKADFYIINRENVPWLVSFLGGSWPFDLVIIDELSSFKSPKAQRFKALRQVRPKIKRVIGLTGTFAPNGLIDLWSQMYLLDQGERLGKTVTGYREQYFKPDKRNGHIVYNYKLRPESEQAIHNKISDICISLKSEDYLQMPEYLEQDVLIKMPADVQKKYDKFEEEQVLLFLESGKEITAFNAAALRMKLRQFANGAIYDESGVNFHEVHTLKIDALEDILEALNGNPLLCFYQFQHDVQQIQKYLGKYNPKKYESAKDKEAWNRGDIQFMLMHPANGYGLNLQYGGHNLAYYGLTDSFEYYRQSVTRLYRQRQEKAVVNKRLLLQGTIDSDDMCLRLNSKEEVDNKLMSALKARIEKYKKL